MTIRQKLYQQAMERGLRQTTVRSYETLLGRLGVLDLDYISPDDLYERLYRIDNPNTRRAAVIACRSVLGIKLKIPKGVPRKYNLPDEDTLRLALMTSPHEIRGLLMMYGGLRIGEACATVNTDANGDQLAVTRQVIQLHKTGEPTVTRIAPVKTTEGAITIPYWLSERLSGVTETAKPDSVRESLRRAGIKVGIALNPHMLRHWYATTLLERGLPFSLVSKQMRHSDIAVTLRTYSQTKSSDVHRVFGESL
jgi:integrase